MVLPGEAGVEGVRARAGGEGHAGCGVVGCGWRTGDVRSSLGDSQKRRCQDIVEGILIVNAAPKR